MRVVRAGKIVTVASFLLVSTISLGSAACRDAVAEGWNWATTLHYSTSDSDSPIDFESIHKKMREKHKNLKPYFDEKKCLCLARIDFVLRPVKGKKEYTVAEVSTVPLQNHVFVSGAERPKIKKHKKNDEISSKSSESKSRERKYVFGCSYSLDEKKGAQEENPKIDISRQVFIHPEDRYFLDLEHLVERIRCRYKGVHARDLPIMAQLAYEWCKLNHHKPSLFSRLVGLSKTTSNELSQKRVEWLKKAKGRGPFHATRLAIKEDDNISDQNDDDHPRRSKNDAEIEPDSESVFFTNNEDSEQKLIYYLNYVTDLAYEYDLLLKIMEDIEKYYCGSQLYHVSGLLGLMHLSTAQSSEWRDNLSSCREYKRDFAQEQGISNRVNVLLERCKEIKKKRKDTSEVIDKFEGFVREVRDIFFAHIEGDAEKIVEHSAKIILAKKNKSGSAKDSCFKEACNSERYKQGSDLYDTLFPEVFKESRKELFTHLRGKRDFIQDKLLKDFDDALDAIVNNYPDHCIAAIVLNVHGSYDSCYCCAPDLARESLRADGFAEYFVEQAQRGYEKAGKKRDKAFFRMIYSCSRIRDKKRCSKCDFFNEDQGKKYEEAPCLSKPGPIGFYQHFLPPDNDETAYVPHVSASPHDEETRDVLNIRTSVSSIMGVKKEAPDDEDLDDAESSHSSILPSQGRSSRVEKITPSNEATPLIDKKAKKNGKKTKREAL